MAKAKKRKTVAAKKGKKGPAKTSKTKLNVGFLLAAKPDDWDDYIDAFQKQLGKNFNVMILPPDGADGDQATIDLTADYMAQYFDVIVTATTYAAQSCLRATKTYLNRTTGLPTPFVFASAGNPLESDLVPNKTDHFCGGDNRQVALVQKRVDHMLNVANLQGPFAVIGNPTPGPSESAMRAAVDTLTANKQSAVRASIKPGMDPTSFVDNLQVKSLYVCSDIFVTRIAKDLAKAAKNANPRIETMWEFKEHITKHGGDTAYGVNITDLFIKAADAVADILKGKTPGEIGIWTAADGPA